MIEPVYVSAVPPPQEFGASPRSPRWPAVRAAFLRTSPACAVCGTREDVEAHHVQAFHTHPELELDPANLLSLCRDHHLWFGHLGAWASINATVREDAAAWHKKIAGRP